MNTTGLLSVFSAGCSSQAVIVPAVVKQSCTKLKFLGFSFAQYNTTSKQKNHLPAR